MSLTGTTNEQKIWNFLKAQGLSDCGTAGLMGNLYAESGLLPNNLQNTYNTKLGMTDAEYTAAVDNGKYTNFIKDSAGYGLAQWTYWTRKQSLQEYAKAAGKSIGDLEMQLCFLMKEMAEGYKSVLQTLKTASSVLAASNAVLLQYERPSNQGTSVQNARASYGQKYYDKYSKTNSGGSTMAYTNSPLVDCTVKSPNHSGKRTHSIDRITPHCVVGQLSAESIGGCFTSTSRQASCNYGIGKDGRVCLIVDEANRSWCSSSNANDQRAITIECASDSAEPYTMNNAVYNKLVALCVDICKRNGKKKLLWLADKEKTLAYTPKADEMVLSVHRWFANKSCPGNWLYNRLGDLATTVTNKLGGGTTTVDTGAVTTSKYPSVPFTVKVLISDLNIRKGAGMSYAVTGKYTGKGVFTITEVKNGWGKLKSGAGWIYLENPSYCTIQGKVSTSAAAWTPAVGDIVNFTGTKHYASANATSGPTCKGGKAKISAISKSSKHPYHLIHTGSGCTVYGWVDAGTFTKA